MKFNVTFWLTVTALFGVLLTATWVISLVWERPRYQFQTLKDRERFACDNGLQVYRPDKPGIELQQELYLSTAPICPKGVRVLSKNHIGSTPNSHRLVWVFELEPSNDTQTQILLGVFEPEDYLVWDNLILMGDPELLDWLESLRQCH
jgi:hypothetical protein